jgi:hypothetical protein
VVLYHVLSFLLLCLLCHQIHPDCLFLPYHLEYESTFNILKHFYGAEE